MSLRNKWQSPRVAAIAAALTVSVALASCGGKETEPAEAPSAEQAAQTQAEEQRRLGEEQVAAAEQPVVESREVMRTISSEIPAVKVTELRGDINRMKPTDFEVLGLPQQLSQNIVNHRNSLGGAYSSVDQLRQVPGMSEAYFSQIQGKLAVAK